MGNVPISIHAGETGKVVPEEIGEGNQVGSDRSEQTYSFPANFTLKAGSIVKVHSGKGNNTATDLYNSTLVWNKKSDSATLKDASGEIVSEHKYPVKVSVNAP